MDHSVLRVLNKVLFNYRGLFYFLGIFVLFFIFIFFILTEVNDKHEHLKVGILYSTTGIMADTERPALRATLLAIEEINNRGGINGQLIEPIVYNPDSNWKKTAELATELIEKDQVVVIFGCFTSASRKEVKEVVEKHDSLLIQSVAYAIEESHNIIYLGMAPNQQIIPAISWIFEQGGKKVYLVGSDYIWPHVSNEIIIHEAIVNNGEIVGNRYLTLGNVQVKDIVDDIIVKKPDFIFSTLIGTSSIVFLNQLYDAVPSAQMPSIISFGITPFEFNKLKKSRFIKLHTVWSYSKLLNNPENKAFLEAYKKKYGSYLEVDDPAATSYAGVYLWSQAVKESPTTKSMQVREYMLRQSLASPAGAIYIDPKSATAWKSVIIERINSNGITEVAWTSSVPIEPKIYPEFKTKAEWNLFEYQLYLSWGNSWEKKRPR
jgi:urea transport system substrate-binding protein